MGPDVASAPPAAERAAPVRKIHRNANRTGITRKPVPAPNTVCGNGNDRLPGGMERRAREYPLGMRETSSTAGNRTARRAAPLFAAGLAVLALAGCGNGTGHQGTAAGGTTAPGATPGTTSAPTATSAPAPSPTGTALPGSTPATPPTAGGTAAPHAAGARCTVTDLRMRLGSGDPGAGNVYYPLRFTNTSGHDCVLDGFPGVSLIRGDGSTIGRAAAREGSSYGTLTLRPGGTAEADLHTLNQGLKGDSCWRRPTFLKVYPPGSRDAMTLATSSPQVCGDTFTVGSVH